MCVDFEIIQEWIFVGSCVFDFGCGDGEFLVWLCDYKQVSGYGLEIDFDNIVCCIENGVNVIEQDFDKGLGNFVSDSFDVVVMIQVLQVVYYLDKIFEEMLWVGKICIIIFFNFGYWCCCWYLVCNGWMLVFEFLLYIWYNMLNIYFCIFQDFECLCCQLCMCVFDCLVVDCDYWYGWVSWLWFNLLGEIGIYWVIGFGVQICNFVVQECVRLWVRVGCFFVCFWESVVEVG